MQPFKLLFLILLLSLTRLSYSEPADNQTATSPDGQWIVFVKPGTGQKIETYTGDSLDPTELWQKDAQGKNLTLLVKCRNSKEPAEIIGGFDNLQFSTDGKLVYSPPQPGPPG